MSGATEKGEILQEKDIPNFTDLNEDIENSVYLY